MPAWSHLCRVLGSRRRASFVGLLALLLPEAGAQTFFVPANTEEFVTSVVSGDTLTKQGPGTLVLHPFGTYNLTNGVIVEAGKLVIYNDETLSPPGSPDPSIVLYGGATLATTDAFSVNITLDSNRPIVLRDDNLNFVPANFEVSVGTVTFGGTFSYNFTSVETGTLRKTGAGTLVLDGTNMNPDRTNLTVAAGLLQLGDSGNVLSDTSGLTLTQKQFGVISVDGGTFRLGAANETIGALAGTGGIVELDNGGGRTLTVNSAISTEYAGVIQGAGGSLVKDSTGTLTLSGSNTCMGATTITAGVLNLRHATGAGTTAGGISVASGAALELQGGIAIGAEALTLNGTGVSADGALRSISGANSYAGAITLGANARINSDSASTVLTLTGGITGTGRALTIGGLGDTTIGTSGLNTGTAGSLTKDGAGKLTISASGSYTGLTTVSAGVLNLQNATATGTIAGGISVTSGAALELQGGIAVGAEALTLNGTGVSSGGALRSISGTNSYAGAITLGSTGVRINSDSASTVLTLTGGITGTGRALTIGGLGDTTIGTTGLNTSTAGSLTKDGAGKLTISASGSYTGLTTVSAGVLNLQNATATGTIAGGISVTSGAALELQGGIVVGAEALTLNGTGVSASGALRSISGANSYAGAITLGSAGVRINSDSASTVLTLTGGITGTGRALTVGGAGDTTIGTNGLNTSTAGTLTKDGTGQLTINAGGSYTGGTTINAGILKIGNATALGPAASANVTFGPGVAAGTKLQLNATSATLVGLNTNATPGSPVVENGTAGAATLTVNNATANTFAGILADGAAGALALTKGAAGVLTLSGANTYTGLTTVSAGVLNLQHATAAGATVGGIAVTSGAALELQGGIAVGAEALTLNGTGVSAGGALRSISGANSYAGPILLGASGARINSDTVGTALTLSGGINGTGRALTIGGLGDTTIGTTGLNTGAAGTLTKDGTGKLTLAASGTYTGGTSLNGGTLALGHSGALGSTGTISFAGGTLQFGVDNTTDYSNRFSTAANQAYAIDTNGESVTLATALTSTGGSLSKSGAGTLTLSGASTYSGGTTIGAGTVSINNSSDSAFGTGAVTVANGATLTGAGSFTGAAQIDGTYSPGNSPALVTLPGNFTLGATGTLLMELGGTTRGTGYDALAIGGALTFGGTLQLSLVNGWTPSGAASFNLLDWDTASGEFATVVVPTLGSGLSWDTSALYTTGTLSINVSAIPEPSTYAALAGLGVLALAAWRRRAAPRHQAD